MMPMSVLIVSVKMDVRVWRSFIMPVNMSVNLPSAFSQRPPEGVDAKHNEHQRDGQFHP